MRMLNQNSADKRLDTGEFKLVMTLLVRDEADIIRQNIEFHLARGVDFIIATDNVSVDGTREILEEYEQKGLLRLIVEEEQNFDQAKWVNRMGRLAYEEHGADVVIHSDADEFWHPVSGNLKEEILGRDVDALYVTVSNVLMENGGGGESFPADTRYLVVKPLETSNARKEWEKTNPYLLRCLEKVFFKSSGGLMEVTSGNHNIVRGREAAKIGLSRDIVIYHYPLRGREHFRRKVLNGGSALEENKKYSKSTGVHWRKWYESYRRGTLEKEYERLTVKKEDARRLLAEGVIAEFDFGDLLSGKAGLPRPDIADADEPGRGGHVLSARNIMKSIDYIVDYGFADFLRRAKEALSQHQR